MTIGLDLHTIIWGVIIILAVTWFLGLVRRGTKRFTYLLLVAAVLLILYNFFLH